MSFAPTVRLAFTENRIANFGLIALIVAWWLWSKNLPEFVLPGPVSVGRRMVDLAADPTFLRHLALSLGRIAVALTLAMILGAAMALLPFYRPGSRYVVERVNLPFFNSFPSLGWVLLATIWFGVSETTVIFIQVAILLPFCLINVAEGVRALDAEALELGNSFTRKSTRVFVRIIMPSLVPFFVGALRISYGVAWKIALLAELFGARDGVGYVMLQAQIAADSATVLATCFFIVLLFVLGDRLVIQSLATRFGEART